MLVVGMMPTRGRSDLARNALDCFLGQSYQEKHLIILDDVDAPSFQSAPDSAQVTYRLMPSRLNIPTKRNLAASMAPENSYLAHFDSDDYSAPDRIESQVRLLEESKLSLCGFSSMLFYSADQQRAWVYKGTDYILGSSFMYTREWWLKHKWKENKPIGSDNVFSKEAKDARQRISVDGLGMIVARVHADNTSFKRVGNAPFRPIDVSELPAGFPK